MTPTILTAEQISVQFNIPLGTLAYWRFKRSHGDDRYPRFYLRGRSVIYYLQEFETDHKALLNQLNPLKCR